MKPAPISAARPAPPLHIGMIAGGGSLPVEIARSVTSRGGTVHAVMIEGEADDALRNFPHTVLNWAELGHAVAALKRAGMRDMVMVGRMSRPSFLTAKPDFGFLFSLPRIVKALRSGGDDAVLRGVVRLFETRGLNVHGVSDVAPELLLTEGPIGFQRPRAEDISDIAIGMALIGRLGAYDIGQAAVVTQGRIEGIEAAEGTDRMVARVAEARLAAGAGVTRLRTGVLVKRAKPGQDRRLDMPAIGPQTVAGAVNAGLAGIAGLSGEVLAAGRFEMVERADRAHVFVSGVTVTSEPPRSRAQAIEPIVFGRIAVPTERTNDVERGVRILGELAEFDTGSALVLARGRVIAVGTSEPAMDVLLRARPYIRRKKREAIMIIGANEAIDEALVRASAAAGIGGIIVMYGPGDGPAHKGPVLDVADRFDMFMAGAAIDPKVAAF